MTDNNTPKPREPRQQGLQHISIPLAQAMEELLQRAAAVQAEEEQTQAEAKEAQ